MTQDNLASSNQFGQQLQEQKYKYFSKSFRAELLFMEAILRKDQNQRQNQQQFFPCFRSDPKTDFIQKLAYKYNRPFCKAFKIMNPHEREIYYQELIHLIRLLQEQIKNESKRQARDQSRETQADEAHMKQWIRHRVQKRLRNNLIKNILPQNFKSTLMPNIMRQSFELKVKIEGTSSEKMVKFDHFLIHLVAKTNKNEGKLILGIRNYLLMSSDQKRYTHRMQSIYPTIQPQTIHLQFSSHYQKGMIIGYLEWIVKIGKIQYLIRNYEIDQKLKVVARQVISNFNSGVYSSVFDRQNQYDDSDEEDSDSGDDISKMVLYQSITINLEEQRNKKMREKLFHDMKQKLIMTLKEIAEKKTKQNERINRFLNRHKKIEPKFKSEAIMNALSDPQNILLDLHYSKIAGLIDIQNQQKKHIQQRKGPAILPDIGRQDRIMKLNSQQLIDEFENCKNESYTDSHVDDSFLSKNNMERQECRNNEVQVDKNRKFKDELSVYSTVFYKDRKIKSDENLTGYSRIKITKDIWIISEVKPQPTQQSVRMKEKAENQAKLQSKDISVVSNRRSKNPTTSTERITTETRLILEDEVGEQKINKTELNEKFWSTMKLEKAFQQQQLYEDINRECSLLQRNNKLNSLKIFIKQPIQLRYLLSIVTDVTSWHEWHPNISSVQLLRQNEDQNICQFQFKCKIANNQFQYKILSHFFCVEDRYYLVMKTLPKEQNRESAPFWKVLNFWKKKNQEVKLDYLLIKVQKSTNDGTSRLTFEFDLDQDTYRKKSKTLNEQATMFLNFYFAHEYWKTIKNKIDALPETERRQTQIQIEKGKRLFNKKLFDIDWVVSNNVMQIKQYNWNKLYGQPI